VLAVEEFWAEVDISTLHHRADIFAYDPGFTSTGTCESKITYIDGENRILLYRGYPIEQLGLRISRSIW
jgi:citrate synthase